MTTDERRQTESFVQQLSAAISESGIVDEVGPNFRKHLSIAASRPQDSGIPIIAGFNVQVPDDDLMQYSRTLASLLCNLISEKFHNLNSLVSANGASGEIVSALTTSALSGSGISLAEFGRRHNIDIELVAFFATYLVRPIRQAASAVAIEEGLAADWHYGYCPVCGLWARMGHIDSREGARKLWCLGCGLEWRFHRMCCPFCLEHRQEQLGYLRVDDSDRFRVYTCDSCKRYLKTLVSSASDRLEYDVEYLSSSALDLTASFEHYVRDFIGFAAFDMKDNAAMRAYRQRALS